MHDIGIMSDVDAVFAKGGAMEALLEMKEQKVVRHLGLTGHYRPDALMECIKRYPFDTILMAMNAADPHHYSFTGTAAAGGGKADGHHRHEDSRPRPDALHVDPAAHRSSRNIPGKEWRPAPTPGTLSMREAMYYTLSRPVSTVIIGCDTVAQLEENVQLAREFTPLSDSQLASWWRAPSRSQAVAVLPLLRARIGTCGGADAAYQAAVRLQ